MRVVPAVLAVDETDFRRKLDLVAGFTDFAQLDFMDGSFVPSRSVGPSAAASSPVDFEAHLMVADPLTWLPGLAGPRLKRVIFHAEAVADAGETADAIRKAGFSPAAALNPETPVGALAPHLSSLDAVLVMSVNPGYYGSPFIPDVLAKVPALKALVPGLIVGLDGGVGMDNLLDARSAGLDYACVGSRILLAEDPAASFRRLTEMAR